MSKGPTFPMKKKMMVVWLVLFCFSFVALAGRLFKLQVLDGTFYAEKAARQQLSTVTISANRGSIYDRNLKPLAQSATVWNVIASPSYITTDAARQSAASALSTILGIDEATLLSKLSQKSSYVVLAKRIEKPTEELVAKYIKEKNIGYIGLVEDSKRYYPYGNFASQLIGFTGSDNQGLTGIEAEYDSVLKGTPGRQVTAKNANGTDMPYDYSDYVAAEDGDNVVLTIDEVVQHYLENAVEQAMVDNNATNRVTGIVMNVQNGEILGMATTPGYDLNDPYTIADSTAAAAVNALSGDEKKKALSNAQQTQWRNKAVSEPYEPGSVFKAITAAAAYDTGVLKRTDMFSDPGSIVVGGHTYHDWSNRSSGTVSFLTGYEQSLNVVFIQVGMRLGIANFTKYVSNFGLTQKTGIDLPGEANSITLAESKYTQVDLASNSFGQGSKFTAIQMITAFAAAANGGYLVQPHVVRELTDSDGNVVKTYDYSSKRQVVSTATSKEMAEIMQLEVEEGSGQNAYVAGYRIGGKTGTAQKLDGDQSARVSSFCGIAPCDDPQYAVLLVIDTPHASNIYGSVIAAPVVGTVFSEILPYLGVEPRYTEEELTKLSVKVSNVVGESATTAQAQLKAAGLSVQTSGSGDTVTGQNPASGEAVGSGGTVVLYLGNAQQESTATMPNLIGMTPAQVNEAMAAAKLNVNFVGLAKDETGETAYEQGVAQGTKLTPGTVVTVKFRNGSLSDGETTG